MEGNRQSRGNRFQFTQEQFFNLQKCIKDISDFLAETRNYTIFTGTVARLDDIINSYNEAALIMSDAQDVFLNQPRNNEEYARKADSYTSLCQALWKAVSISNTQLANGITKAGYNDVYSAFANNMTRSIGFYLNNVIQDLNQLESKVNRGRNANNAPITYPAPLYNEQALTDAYFQMQRNQEQKQQMSYGYGQGSQQNFYSNNQGQQGFSGYGQPQQWSYGDNQSQPMPYGYGQQEFPVDGQSQQWSYGNNQSQSMFYGNNQSQPMPYDYGQKEFPVDGQSQQWSYGNNQGQQEFFGNNQGQQEFFGNNQGQQTFFSGTQEQSQPPVNKSEQPQPSDTSPEGSQPPVDEPEKPLPSVTAEEQLNATTTEFVDVVRNNSMNDTYPKMLASLLRIEDIMQTDPLDTHYENMAVELRKVIFVMQNNLSLFSEPVKNDGDVFKRLQVLKDITSFTHQFFESKDPHIFTLRSVSDVFVNSEFLYLTQRLAENMNTAIAAQNAISSAVGKKYSGAPEPLKDLTDNLPLKFKHTRPVYKVLDTVSQHTTFDEDAYKAIFFHLDSINPKSFDSQSDMQMLLKKQYGKFYSQLKDYRTKFIEEKSPVNEEGKLSALKSLSAEASVLVDTIDQVFETLRRNGHEARQIISLVRFAVNEINKQVIDKEIKRLGGDGIDDAILNSTKSILGVDVKDFPKLPEKPVLYNYRTTANRYMNAALRAVMDSVKGFECYDPEKTTAAENIYKTADTIRNYLNRNSDLFERRYKNADDEFRRKEALGKIKDSIKDIFTFGKEFLAPYYVCEADENVEKNINNLRQFFNIVEKDYCLAYEPFHSEPDSAPADLKRRIPPENNYAETELNIENLSGREWLYTNDQHKQLQENIEAAVKKLLEYASGEENIQETERFLCIASNLTSLYEEIEPNPIGNLGPDSSQTDFRNAAAILSSRKHTTNIALASCWTAISHINSDSKKGELAALMSSIINLLNLTRKDMRALQCLHNSDPNGEISNYESPDATELYNGMGDDVKDITPKASEKPDSMTRKDYYHFKVYTFCTNPDKCTELSDKFRELSMNILGDPMEQCENSKERAGLMNAAQELMEISNHLLASKELFKEVPENSADLGNIIEAQKSLRFARDHVETVYRVLAGAFYGSSTMVGASVSQMIDKIAPALNTALNDCSRMNSFQRKEASKEESEERKLHTRVFHYYLAKENEKSKKAARDSAKNPEMPAYLNTSFDPLGGKKLTPEQERDRLESLRIAAAKEEQDKWNQEKSRKKDEEARRKKEEQEQKKLEEEKRRIEEENRLEEERKLQIKRQVLLTTNKPERFFMPKDVETSLELVDKLIECYKGLRLTEENKDEIEQEKNYLSALQKYISNNEVAYLNEPEKWDSGKKKRLEVLENIAGVNKFIEEKARKRINDFNNDKRFSNEKATFNKVMQELREHANFVAENFYYQQVLSGIVEPVYEYDFDAIEDIPEQNNKIEFNEEVQEEENEPGNEEIQEEVNEPGNDEIQEEVNEPDNEEIQEEGNEPDNERSESVEIEGPQEIEQNNEDPRENVRNNADPRENVRNNADPQVIQAEIPPKNEVRENEEPQENINPENIIDTNIVLRDSVPAENRGSMIGSAPEQHEPNKKKKHISFTDPNVKPDDLAREYLNEFTRLRDELAKTDSSLSNDTLPYKNLRDAMNNAVKAMSGANFHNLPNNEKDNVLENIFKSIKKPIKEYREAKAGLEKLSSRQIKRLKVMNRISLLRALYESNIAKPNSSYKLKLAEKLVNNFLVEQAPKNKSAADKLIKEKDFLLEVKNLKEDDVFKAYLSNCDMEKIEKTVKKNGASALKEFRAWVKQNNRTMPAMLSAEQVPQAENQMQMGGMH